MGNGQYEGEMNESGQAHGNGTMRWSDGEYHEGEWRKGKPHGKGVRRNGGNGCLFRGEFRNGCFSSGSLICPSKEYLYVGGFDCEGWLHGSGIVTYFDGTRIEGEWVHARGAGAGFVTHPDGTKEQVRDIQRYMKYIELKRRKDRSEE
mgnify:FL=1